MKLNLRRSILASLALLPLASSLPPFRIDKHGEDITSDYDIQKFYAARVLNMDEVGAAIGFTNHTRNPYPPGNYGYNVEINYEQNCYVVFQDEQKETYNLISAEDKPEGAFGVHLSHVGPCGACSTLQDLAVFLDKRDLTTPVRKCAMIPVGKAKRNCIRKVGFSEKCVWIWYWNAAQTGKSKRSGGCRRTCIRHLKTPNNQEYGTDNPCKPAKKNEYGMYEDDLDPSSPSADSLASTPSRGLFATFKKKQPLTTSDKMPESKGQCKNTINHEPACDPMQYNNGPYRLNPCLQCDECKSGPIFKKLSGRTRRGSGIRSAIERPGVPNIYHHYYSKASHDEL